MHSEQGLFTEFGGNTFYFAEEIFNTSSETTFLCLVHWQNFCQCYYQIPTPEYFSQPMAKLSVPLRHFVHCPSAVSYSRRITWSCYSMCNSAAYVHRPHSQNPAWDICQSLRILPVIGQISHKNDCSKHIVQLSVVKPFACQPGLLIECRLNLSKLFSQTVWDKSALN